MIDLDVVNLSVGVIAISIIYGAYKLGYKNGKNSGFAFGSNSRYELLSCSFESGYTEEETIQKIQELLKVNNTFAIYYNAINLILNRIILEQKEGKLEKITPRYIYDKFLYPFMEGSERMQSNYCLDCIKKEGISLLKDFRSNSPVFMDNPINNNLLDTKTCSCCGKTNDVLNPFIYTVLTELKLDSYFGTIDNNQDDKCPRIWHNKQ